MKNYILFSLSITVFFGFVGAYNCSTLDSRLEDFLNRYEDFVNRYDAHARVGQKVSNEYEASLRFEDYYKMEAEDDRMEAEKEVLFEEKNRCDDLRETYNSYLKKGDTASEKLANKGTYDADLAEEALKYYKKAYDMLDYNFTDYQKKKTLVKKQIDSLTEYIDKQEADIKAQKEWNKLTEQYNEALDYGQKGDYDNAIKILEKILKNEGTVERGDNYDLARKVLSTYKEGKKTLEEGEKYYQETGKVPTNENTSKLPELNQAISWMYEKGLTVFNEPTSFMAYNGLRRDEAAKFFVKYAKEVMGMIPDYSKQGCSFKDLDQAWSDLKDVIIESCQLGLFQGNKGKFMPTQQLTNAQAITVFMRLREGYKDESGSHFANNYYESAHAQGLLYDTPLDNRVNFDNYTTRGDVAKMLFRGQKS